MSKRFLSVVLAVALVMGFFSGISVTARAASEMKTSDKCVAMIEEMEGFIATPVWDYGQWTVGFGTACPAEDLERYQKEGIPMVEAHALMRKHIAEFESQVNSFIDRKGLTLNQGQFDALVSLTYNVGTALLYSSSGTLYDAIVNGTTGNEFIYAISLWCTAGGQFLPGLMRRRLVEANMYLNGKYGTQAPENYCYVLYDANGGKRDASAQGYDCNMPAVPMSVPTYEGYTFLGWYTEPDGGTKVTSLNETTHGMTLYAHWQKGTNTPQTPTVPESGVNVTVTGSSVYVRSGPGTNYGIIGGVFRGDQLVITGVTDVNGTLWGKFSKGWVCLTYTNYSQLVDTDPPGDEPDDKEEPPLSVPVNATVLSASGIVVYNGPHTSYPQVGKLSKGQQIEILETMTFQNVLWARYKGGWFQLNLRVMVHDESVLAHSFTTTVNYYSLNIRSAPGTENSKVGSLNSDTQVQVFALTMVDGTPWGRIEQGWISLDYTTYDAALLPQYQNHSYGSWYTSKEATCVEKGQERHDCAYCSHYETRETALTDHSFGDWYVTKEATCVEAGEERRDCQHCDHYETRETALTDHSFGDWYVTKEATCVEAGEEHRDCQHCDHYETQVTDIAEHSFGEWYVTKDATMTEEGEERRDCQHCDHYETRVIDITEHSYGDWYVSKNATCTEAGEERRDCQFCDHSETRQIEMLAHSYGDWYVSKNATCTEAGEERRDCQFCDHSETREIEALDHSYGEWYVSKNATCKEAGEERRDCQFCDHYETQEIVTLDHSYGEWYVSKDATCTTKGEARRDCQYCDHYETRDTAVIGHSYGDWYVSKEATFTEQGEERRDCEHCDHFETRQTPCKPLPITKTYATMTNAAYTSLNIRSGAGFRYSVVGRLAYGGRVEILEQKTVDGDVWGRTEQGWICLSGYTTLETVIVNGPYETTVKTYITVTCDLLNVRSGAGSGYSRVGQLKRGARVEILERKTVGSSVWGRTQQGWICLTGYTMLETVEEISDTAHTEHSYGDWYVSKDATCTAKGEERRNCQHCDHYETREIAATGHSYGDWYVSKDATCTAKGGERRNCQHCDHYETREIAAAGHSYGDWYVSKDATSTEEGEERRDCQHCGHHETRVLPCKPQSTKTYGTMTNAAYAYLNIRSNAGFQYGVLDKLPYGTRVEILEQKTVDGNVWGRIEQGWVCITGYMTLETVSVDDPAEPVTKTYGTMTNAAYAYLNIRSNAGFQYGVLGVLAYGTRVEILEQKTVDGNVWGRIAQGWICITGYMTLETVTVDDSSASDAKIYATVTYSLLNIRSGAGSSYSCLGQLKRGDKVEILEQKAVGSKVWGRTSAGWICLTGYTKL